MVLGGLGGCWLVMLGFWAYLASEAILVVLVGLGGYWVVINGRGTYLASV